MPSSWRLVCGLFVAAVLAISPARPQDVTLTGTVVDDSTGAPLSAAHVFVSGTMTGTVADDSGRFRLTGVSDGAKRLYVTHVGYEAKKMDLVLPPDTTLAFGFRLEPTVLEAGHVTVSDERSEEWYEHVDRFNRLFVGSSEEAERCHLLNPEVLYFDTAWWGKFEAGADRPLKFENRALGYRVTYYLTEFEERGDIIRWDGEPLFAPLTPRDSSEAARWAENRKRAFYGSLRHFLLALLNDRVEEEQFRTYQKPRARAFRDPRRARRIPVTREDILKPASDSLYTVNFTGALEVRYDGAPESEAYLEWTDARRAPRDVQTSRIQLNERPIHLDRHGEIVEPYGATLYHYFAFRQRLATMLPRGYRPPDTQLTATTPNP